MTMTERLTDDEIAKLRERTRIDAASHFHLVARDTITALLDEIEERRRIDARRLADAEQAFREECGWIGKGPADFPLSWFRNGKDGGA